MSDTELAELKRQVLELKAETTVHRLTGYLIIRIGKFDKEMLSGTFLVNIRETTLEVTPREPAQDSILRQRTKDIKGHMSVK